MRHNFIIVILLVLATLSCNRTRFVGTIPVRMAEPQETMKKSSDPVLLSNSHGLSHMLNIQIVADSIMVVQKQIAESDSNHFMVYSTESFEYLGSCVSCGRGPTELLSPYIPSINPDMNLLYTNDNNLGEAYGIDILESLKASRGVISQVTKLPRGVVDWAPISPSSQITFCVQGKQFSFLMIDPSGRIVKSIQPFGDLDADHYMTKLSFLMTVNQETGQVAMPMVCFPQMLLLDTETDDIHSIAVDKAARRWETILNTYFDQNSVQYYSGVASSSKYIFASYWGCSIGKTMAGGHGSKIHVFNWEGDLLYEILVKEDIGPITYDQKSRYLYGVDISTDKIVRYDLSDIGLTAI